MHTGQPHHKSPLIGEALKKEIKKKLITAMLDSFEKGEMTQDDMEFASNIVLDEMPKVHTQEQLLQFLEQLKGVWKQFDSVYLSSKTQETSMKEKEVIDRLSNYIKTLN